MSMDEAPSGAAAEAGPEQVGDTAAEVQPPEGDEPPARQYIEVDDPDNRYARVRAHDEDVEVPYSELVRGYSREADYTRKMQALAEQRREADYGLRLQQALETNPELTLQILAQQHGYNFGQPAAAPTDDEPDYADPLERQLAEERQARMALEQRITQREADEQLERTLSGLRQQYNLNDEDVRNLVGTAYQMGVGVEGLPMIWQSMMFQRLEASVQARRAEQQRKEAETARRQAAAATATQTVATRTSGGNGLTDQVPANGRMTIREAIEAAFEQAERSG